MAIERLNPEGVPVIPGLRVADEMNAWALRLVPR